MAAVEAQLEAGGRDGGGGLTFVFVCASRSIVNGTFSEVKEAMFAHMPSLQLL